jgi:maltose O-acetyltransferase
MRSFEEIFINYFIPFIPSRHLRYFFLKVVGVKIGKNLSMYSTVEIRCPSKLNIKDDCSIGKYVLLDARKGLIINKRVTISSHALIWTLHHDYNSNDFHDTGDPVEIGEYAWVCSRVIILPGVKIGKAAVVAAGAVVTKDVEPYTIVGGIPAKVIGMRKKIEFQYVPNNHYHFI